MAEESRPIRDIEDDETPDAEKAEKSAGIEDASNNDGESKTAAEDDATSDLVVIQAPSVRAEAIVDDDDVAPEPRKKDSKASDLMVNLFDEDGNAILPDGTLIIQPTDVDGDRTAIGPAPPAEGSSLQFDFKDGNPDPKFKLAANAMNNQSAQGNISSGAGGIANSEPGVLDVVKCTTCTAKLNPYHKDDLAVHPVLKVITCKVNNLRRIPFFAKFSLVSDIRVVLLVQWCLVCNYTFHPRRTDAWGACQNTGCS